MTNSPIKELAVIILNWNGIELLKKFLPGAVSHTSGEQVDLIIADNASTDGSVEWIKDNFPDIKVIEFDKNYGFAEGYNKAIGATRYPFTILLNSDVETTPGWWQPLLSFMKDNPEAGAAQPKIKSFHNKEFFEYAGAAGGLLDYFGYPYCRGRLFDSVEIDTGQYDFEATNLCWASGAALCVRTELYERLGGLDTLFFAHMEEIDLCCRMLAAGYKICFIPSSEIFHVGGATLNQGSSTKTYLNFRNNLLLLYKNLPRRKRDKKIFIRQCIDTFAVLMFLAKLDFPNARAVVRAHQDFRKMKKKYPSDSKVPDDFVFPGSNRKIILERFLLNKKN